MIEKESYCVNQFLFDSVSKMLFAVVLLVILSLITISSLIGSILINKYINSKPIGFQTLLDKLTIKLLNSMILFVFVVAFQSSLALFFVSFPPRVAQILFYGQSFVCNYYYAWYVAVICIKYLSIFHSSLVEFELTDSQVSNRINIFIICIICFLIGIEQGTVSDYQDFTVYQLMSGQFSNDGKKGTGMTKVTLILQVLDISFAIFTYSRIEKHFHKDLMSQENQCQNETKNEIKIARIAFVLTIMFIPFCLFLFTKIDLSNNYSSSLTGTIVTFLYAVLPPLLYIHRSNDQMKDFVSNCIKSAVSYNRK